MLTLKAFSAKMTSCAGLAALFCLLGLVKYFLSATNDSCRLLSSIVRAEVRAMHCYGRHSNVICLCAHARKGVVGSVQKLVQCKLLSIILDFPC